MNQQPYQNNLFILKTIQIKEKSEEDLHREWLIRNIQYDTNKMTCEDYIEFLDSWDDKKYSYDYENNCYFTDLEKAKFYATSNMGDINDGGVYNYVAIVEVPYNRTYATTEIQSIYIFKFNYKKDTYEEVDLNSSEETKFILNKNCCMHLLEE